jgi:hypothetical protein
VTGADLAHQLCQGRRSRFGTEGCGEPEPRGYAVAAAQRRVLYELIDRLSKLSGVARRHHTPRDAVGHNLRDCAGPIGDDRQSCRHRLEHSVGAHVRVARKDECIGVLEDVEHLAVAGAYVVVDEETRAGRYPRGGDKVEVARPT